MKKTKVAKKRSGFGRFGKYFARLSRYTAAQLFNYALNRAEARSGRSHLFSYPTFVDIVPTKLCNLNCVFCIEYETAGSKFLTRQNFRRILEKLPFSPAKIAFASGGEPFLNKNLPEFLAICKRRKISNLITTNGMLLDAEIIRAIVRDSRVAEVRFSFDGATRATVERIRRGVSYDRVVSNMVMLTEEKKRCDMASLHTAIQCAIMKSNIRELPELVQRAKQWGIEQVIVSYVNFTDRLDGRESLFYHPQLAEQVFAESERVARSTGIRLKLPPRLTPEQANGTDMPCHLPWTYLKIDPDGSVRFCYKAWENPIGNIFAVENFRQLWNNKHYRLLRKTVNSNKPYFKYCSTCTVRKGKNYKSAHFHSSGNYEFDSDFEAMYDIKIPQPEKQGERTLRGIGAGTDYKN